MHKENINQVVYIVFIYAYRDESRVKVTRGHDLIHCYNKSG